jgi:UDP-N-acetyl-D-galactosamine dehydrogenase
MRRDMSKEVKLDDTIVCMIGLGYVGLPLAKAFSRCLKVIGFDANSEKVRELRSHNQSDNLIITDDPRQISAADFAIIAVPTPVTKSKEPDLSYVTSAVRTISQHMKAGCTVVLESTVYPGVTEEVVKPILDESGLRCGQEYRIAYSPERINPGDTEHDVDKVTKVVGGMDSETTELVARLYSKICPKVFKAKDIRTAEAAKVIENVQRDLNIALVNELCVIFDRMGLNTNDVLDAAATKWNFNRFSPGMVGGHCIPVDPYYLVYKARELGYHSQVILAGRAMNDYMPKHVAQMAIKGLNDVGKKIKGSMVLIMGLAYKENVADDREAPAQGMIREFREYGVEPYGYDPLLSNIEKGFGIRVVSDLKKLKGVDCIVLTVKHDVFSRVTLRELKAIMNDNPVLIDIKGFYDRQQAQELGFYYRQL